MNCLCIQKILCIRNAYFFFKYFFKLCCYCHSRVCKDLVFSFAQIMKLYESSSKVDSKVSVPEFAHASFFALFVVFDLF